MTHIHMESDLTEGDNPGESLAGELHLTAPKMDTISQRIIASIAEMVLRGGSIAVKADQTHKGYRLDYDTAKTKGAVLRPF